MFKWSSAQADPRNRFDEWREVRAKGLFGVTAELEPERRGDFFGEFSLRRLDQAGLVEMRASPYRVERSKGDIANSPSDSLCIYQQLSSGGWFDTRTNDFTVGRGAIATSYSDLPYSTVPTGADGFHLRILKIPVVEIWPSRAGIHDLLPQPFGVHRAILPLLESCFADIFVADKEVDTKEAARLVQTLAHLALIKRGVLKPGSSAAMQALRFGRLSLARRLIAGNLSDPRLSPAFVADRLAISVRHLHAIFETTGISFSQTATMLRLEESCRVLVMSPEQSITKVALACGFDSLATFYRAFRTAYGTSPGDFRMRDRRGS